MNNSRILLKLFLPYFIKAFSKMAISVVKQPNYALRGELFQLVVSANLHLYGRNAVLVVLLINKGADG